MSKTYSDVDDILRLTAPVHGEETTRYRVVVVHENGSITPSTVMQSNIKFSDIAAAFAAALKNDEPFVIRTSPFDSYAIFSAEYMRRCKIKLIREDD